MRKHATTVAALGAVMAVGALTPAATASGGNQVTIKGSTLSTYHFAPKTLHIEKGDNVHWSWNSNAPHNVTFKKISAASDTASSGKFQHRFKKTGTFRYVCTIHDFTGKIVVG